jgi:hypothetical protein
MDWRDSKRLEVSFNHNADDASQPDTKRIVDITCTPCQHFTGRTLWDSFKTLWASWVVEEVFTDDLGKSARPPVKVYFAGDTAYRTVLDGEDEDEVPHCPAFEETGKTFGGFDFAMIPIGYASGRLIFFLAFVADITLQGLPSSRVYVTNTLRTSGQCQIIQRYPGEEGSWNALGVSR